MKQFAGIADRFIQTIIPQAKSEAEARTTFARECSFAAQQINSNSQLIKSTAQSRMEAVLNLANIGLTLNPVVKHAYLVPRSVKSGEGWEVKCCLEPSYMGLIKLLTDSGSVKSMRAEIVYKGDEFMYDKAEQRVRTHISYWQLGREAGEILGGYTVAMFPDGSTETQDMGRDIMDKIKNSSESVKAKRSSPYDNWQEEMFRKAMIKRHFKTLPKTKHVEQFASATELDNEDFAVAAPKTPATIRRSANQMSDARYQVEVMGQASADSVLAQWTDLPDDQRAEVMSWTFKGNDQ